MIISREYTITPKTSLSDKTIDDIKCAKGTITRVRFISAPGVNYEVYVRLLHFEDSIIPNETGEWLALSGVVQEFSPNWKHWNNVYNLNVELCSPEARFSHDIQLEIEIEEEYTLVELFKMLIGRTTR